MNAKLKSRNLSVPDIEQEFVGTLAMMAGDQWRPLVRVIRLPGAPVITCIEGTLDWDGDIRVKTRALREGDNHTRDDQP